MKGKVRQDESESFDSGYFLVGVSLTLCRRSLDILRCGEESEKDRERFACYHHGNDLNLVAFDIHSSKNVKLFFAWHVLHRKESRIILPCQEVVSQWT